MDILTMIAGRNAATKLLDGLRMSAATDDEYFAWVRLDNVICYLKGQILAEATKHFEEARLVSEP